MANMGRTIKKTLGLMLATITLLSVTACSSSFGSQVKLNVLAPEKFVKKGGWILTMEDAFRKEHPEVSFTNTPIKQFDKPYQPANKDKYPKVSADVLLFKSNTVHYLISAGILGKLSKDSEKQIEKQNPTPLLNSLLKGNSHYGIPYTSDTWFMYYDKSKLSENDVKSLNTMLQKQKVALNLRGDDLFAGFYIDSCINFGAYSPKTDSIDSVNFNENCYPITKYLTKLVNEPNFINAASDTGIESLRNGSAAAYFSGIWEANDVKKILGKNFAAAPLPKVRADQGYDTEEYDPTANFEYQMKQVAGSQAIGYNAKSKHRDLAEKFAAFLGSTKSQKKAYELQKVVPSDKTLKSFVANDPAASAQMQSVEKTSVNQPLADKAYGAINYLSSLSNDISEKTLNDDNQIFEYFSYAEENVNKQLRD